MTDAADNRRQIAVAAKADGKTVAEITRQVASAGIVNPQTGKPYSESTILRDITAVEIIGEATPLTSPINPQTLKPGKTVVSTTFGSLYGRSPYGSDYTFWGQRRSRLSFDATRADYLFWDQLRHGRAPGFRFAGLLCRPTTRSVASFVWGDGPNLAIRPDPEDTTDNLSQIKPNEAHTNRYLDAWMQSVRGLLYNTLNDCYALGDQFIVTNADGSLSIPSPDSVTIEYDALDYRKIVAYTITTRLDQGTITDRYTDDERTVMVETVVNGVRSQAKQTFPILIGRNPVVMWANDRGGNELSGRPIYDADYHLFERIDTLIEKLLDGVELHGNPIPVIQGLENIQATLAANAAPTGEVSYDRSGNVISQSILDWNRNGALLLGKGGTVAMLSPQNGFTSDIINTLHYLLFLFCMHVDIPEFMLGSMGDSGNRSLTDNQFKVFVEKIKARRMAVEGVMSGTEQTVPRDGLLELADVQLRTRKLMDAKIVIKPTKANWPHLTMEEAQVTLQKTIYANSQQTMRPEIMLGLLDLVSNPDETVAQADAYYAAHPEKLPGADTFQSALNQASYENMTPSAGNDGSPAKTENPAGGTPAANMSSTGDTRRRNTRSRKKSNP